MKHSHMNKRKGFTLMETVIAIGVLAVMLTAFMGVFGPATKTIRKAINVQEADRLTSALEKELSTNRPTSGNSGEATTAFHKAYDWIMESHEENNAVFAYQYRGDPNTLRADGTMTPYLEKDGQAGKDFVVQPMFRRRDDKAFVEDMASLEGRVFFVKMTQLVFSNNAGLTLGEAGKITPPPQPANSPTSALTGQGADGYPEAVIPFTADFYEIQTTDVNFLKPGGKFNPASYPIPMFSRNLAVRR